MTEDEPGNAEILAAIRTQGRLLAEIAAKVGQLEADQRILRDSGAQGRGENRAGFQAVREDLRQVREDIAGVKADTAFTERYQADMHEALTRHIADPNAHRPAA